MTTSLTLPLCAIGLAVIAAAADAPRPGGAAPAAQPGGGWKMLFDGKTTKGWHNYKQTGPVQGWEVVDGALVRQSKGGDLVSDEEFGDFELSLEWKLPAGGNSGIFYRAPEDAAVIWHHAIEYQLLDNAAHNDGKNQKRSTGAAYDMYEPVRDVTKPIGEWNETRIIARGNHVEHWLNGTKLLEFEIGSPSWNERFAASKFKPYPEFGKTPKGKISLQEHGNVVSFRNIRIRPITS
jgi:Domain of Unknown Function (DUF1080)